MFLYVLIVCVFLLLLWAAVRALIECCMPCSFECWLHFYEWIKWWWRWYTAHRRTCQDNCVLLTHKCLLSTELTSVSETVPSQLLKPKCGTVCRWTWDNRDCHTTISVTFVTHLSSKRVLPVMESWDTCLAFRLGSFSMHSCLIWLKTFLFGQWDDGAVWTLTASSRNILTYLLTLHCIIIGHAYTHGHCVYINYIDE